MQFHIRAFKLPDGNEISAPDNVFYLVGVKPLLKPQLALPAEEEDKLYHGEQAELFLF